MTHDEALAAARKLAYSLGIRMVVVEDGTSYSVKAYAAPVEINVVLPADGAPGAHGMGTSEPADYSVQY